MLLLKFSEALRMCAYTHIHICARAINFNISSKIDFTYEVYIVHLFSFETNI